MGGKAATQGNITPQGSNLKLGRQAALKCIAGPMDDAVLDSKLVLRLGGRHRESVTATSHHGNPCVLAAYRGHAAHSAE